MKDTSDTSAIFVTGPTVFAVFPITQAEVDSDADAAETLDDYQYYLATAIPALRARGIAVYDRYTPQLGWRIGSQMFTRVIPSDSAPVYILVSPDRPSRGVVGVQTDVDLIDTAMAYFFTPK